MKHFLDWSSYRDAGMGDAYADIPKNGGDFAKAVAVCIGSQACEQNGRGVMCPSYRVSGKAELSTGGRVKLLKAALNSESADALVSDPEVYAAMDLCVSCKGCKRECENEVDMALIKAEYLAQRFSLRGVPLRNRLFANVPALLNRFSFISGLIRWRNRSAMLARLGQWLLRIDARVSLPEPAQQPFLDHLSGNEAGLEASDAEVVLFVDSFNRHFSPATSEAAIALLQAGGYQVILPQAEANDEHREQPLCCGRTYFANGMIDEARRQARRMLSALKPHLDAGRRIIGLEPSCILSLRDEYLSLGLGDEAGHLAKNVLLLEEFIAREHAAGRWQVKFSGDAQQKVLVHGHCHQKAVGATKAMRKVLKLIPQLKAELIESSCCGMAGHFGLESEHAAMSRQMAEQALYPALRAEPDVAVIANGFSCQQQIANGGFAKPRHIAEVLYAAMENQV